MNETTESSKPINDIPNIVVTKEFARSVAQDTYVWGWPLVNSFNRRKSFSTATEPGLRGGILPVAPVGEVCMLSNYISPAQRWVAHPNQDVVYGFGYAATDKEPVVIQVPDFKDRFWVYALYDARSDEFSNLGKQYGTKPGFYLVVGPNWKGEIPNGITGVIKAPTDLVAMGPRIFMDDSNEDHVEIQNVLNQVMVYPIKKFDGKMKTKIWANVPELPVPGQKPTTADSKAEIIWVNPKSFFDELLQVLDEVPPLAGEESRYAMIRTVLSAAEQNPELKKVLIDTAIQTEEEIIKPLFDFQTNGEKIANGWNTPPNGAAWGFDYLSRTATAKSNMYVNQPQETRYFFIQVDDQQQRLNGSHSYTLSFTKDEIPPVNGFWSLTMYDEQHFFAPNELERYSLGTKSLKRMKFNSDGSLTIFIQNESPGEDKTSNWLPAPKGNFEMTIRTYWPKPEVNEGRWNPPAIIRKQRLQ